MLEESLCRVNVMIPKAFTVFFTNALKCVGLLVLRSALLCFSTEWAATKAAAHQTGSVGLEVLVCDQAGFVCLGLCCYELMAVIG